jgi:hypothetical protein
MRESFPLFEVESRNDVESLRKQGTDVAKKDVA